MLSGDEEEDPFKPREKVLQRTPVKKSEKKEVLRLSRPDRKKRTATNFFEKFRRTPEKGGKELNREATAQRNIEVNLFGIEPPTPGADLFKFTRLSSQEPIQAGSLVQFVGQQEV